MCYPDKDTRDEWNKLMSIAIGVVLGVIYTLIGLFIFVFTRKG
jgi:hypothetical protein